jgi:hypothetical protein
VVKERIYSRAKAKIVYEFDAAVVIPNTNHVGFKYLAPCVYEPDLANKEDEVLKVRNCDPETE